MLRHFPSAPCSPTHTAAHQRVPTDEHRKSEGEGAVREMVLAANGCSPSCMGSDTYKHVWGFGANERARRTGDEEMQIEGE